MDFEPKFQVSKNVYFCDKAFHTEELRKSLNDDGDRYDFIIADGKGALFATLSGTRKKIIHKFNVDLPRKHGSGGQSANRFARLRQEARHVYLKKICEMARKLFVDKYENSISSGLVLGGSADIKTELQEMITDPKYLSNKISILKIVDVSYGGHVGLNQAISLAESCLQSVKLVQETKIIRDFFDLVQTEDEKVCFGVEETMTALDNGNLKTLLVWNELKMKRLVVKDSNPVEIIFKPKNKQLEGIEVEQEEDLLDWILDHVEQNGTRIEIITDQTEEGMQFINGFDGFGGILRFAIKLEN